MRYLRMLTNATVGGVLVAIYLLVLVLQLNPHVEVVSMTTWWWFLALLAFYGPYVSLALFFLLLMRDAVSIRPLAPAWFSVRLLAWVGAAVAAAAAVITWANLEGFRAVLSVDAAERMRLGATATTVFAALMLAVAVLRYSFGRRGSRTTGALLVIVLLLSVALPVYLRGPVELPVPAAQRVIARREIVGSQLPNAPGALVQAPTARRRVRLILLDGASLGFIRQRVAAGQLPNFGNLLDRGAWMYLATLKPTQAEPVWTAAATGKYPPRTGIRSNALYRVGPEGASETAPVNLLPDYCFAYALLLQEFVREDASALTSDAIRGRPFWEILGDWGLQAGIVAWPLTYPARADRGFVVSDRFDEAANSPLGLADPDTAAPTTALDIAQESFYAWLSRPFSAFLPSIGPASLPPGNVDVARWDHAYGEAAVALEPRWNPSVLAVRYEGLDAFGHTALEDAQPELFGELRRDAPERSLLDQHYAFVDAEVGRAIRRLAPGDLLIVMSGFGMERTPLSKRLLARLLGNDDPSGTHEQAPDGFLIAYGSNVEPGEIRRGAIVDLAPTVLYYLNLAVGRDMDGFARTDLFQRRFTDRPVTYVPTHEGVLLAEGGG